MKIWQYLLIALCFYILYGIISFLAKKKKPFKRAFLTMLLGVIVLVAVDVASIFTGVYVPISPLSLTVSSCLGVPGVAAMIVMGWVL